MSILVSAHSLKTKKTTENKFRDLRQPSCDKLLNIYNLNSIPDKRRTNNYKRRITQYQLPKWYQRIARAKLQKYSKCQTPTSVVNLAPILSFETSFPLPAVRPSQPRPSLQLSVHPTIYLYLYLTTSRILPFLPKIMTFGNRF